MIVWTSEAFLESHQLTRAISFLPFKLLSLSCERDKEASHAKKNQHDSVGDIFADGCGGSS